LRNPKNYKKNVEKNQFFAIKKGQIQINHPSKEGGQSGKMDIL
jgi:hypothetical protein